MNTKLKIAIIVVLVLSVVAAYRVVTQHETTVPDPVPVLEVTTPEVEQVTPVVTEQYQGLIGTTTTVFEHIDYVEYRYVEGDVVRTGELNTERGFGDDPDATVYVLDWEKPEPEQLRFVRLTAEPDTLYQVTEATNLVPNWSLTLQ